MKQLTIKDFVDVEIMAGKGSSYLEQNAFILSRYFGHPIETILAQDARMINIMMEEVDKYVKSTHNKDDREILKQEFKETIDKEEEIDNRFDILDL